MTAAQHTHLADLTMPRGLTQHEAEARHAHGLGNVTANDTSRSYWHIARSSIFTFYNTILFGLGAVLSLLGRWQDAVVAVSVVLINVVIGMFQEVRAKQTLDHIALITRPKATVLRDGQAREVPPEAIVQGDLLVIAAGDQFVADGHVTGAGQIAVDESLLTGEADLVTKHAGDAVYAGTFCVTGSGNYLAEAVGAASTANRLAAGARAAHNDLTPLQRDINLIIQILLLVAIFIEVLIGGNAVIKDVAFVDFIRRSVVVSSIIPVGLFLSITVAYAVGAVRLVGQGMLIQHQNATEALSHVEVLCLDKTGTLTTGQLRMGESHPLGIAPETLTRQLGIFAASGTSSNATSTTIATSFPEPPLAISAEVPFSSTRKWSALSFTTTALMAGTFVLGAPEMVSPALAASDRLAVQAQAEPLATTGKRVLLFATSPDPVSLGTNENDYHLPARLQPLGLLTISDELRPEARATLAAFAQTGVTVKIISGDSPRTVFALAHEAGIPADAQLIAGPDLARLDDAGFAQAAVRATIFGRITPQQKERLVQSLRANGRHVAMTGDGVNDVLALKAAHVGIAMQSGSAATRSVADIVLLHDSFAPLPAGLSQGQCIRNGMENIIALFLARTLFVILTVIAIATMTDTFAFTPKTNSLLALLAGGIPALALATWTHPGVSRRRGIFDTVLHFTLPAGLVMTVLGIGVFVSIYVLPGDTSARAQTALTLFGTTCTILLLLFVMPPVPPTSGSATGRRDQRPAYLALGLLTVLIAITALPLTRAFFDLALLSWPEVIAVAIAVVIWVVVTRRIWHAHLLERFLRLEE